MINPLSPFQSRLAAITGRINSEAVAESKLVCWTMKRLGCDEHLREAFRLAGSRDVTCNVLNTLPRFPMTFGYTQLPDSPPIHRDQKAVHPLWFKSFRSLPFMSIYVEQAELADTSRPFGLIFPRKGFGQGLIVHDGDPEMFVPELSCCHMFRGGGRYTKNLVVQPYMTLIDCIRDDLAWVP